MLFPLHWIYCALGIEQPVHDCKAVMNMEVPATCPHVIYSFDIITSTVLHLSLSLKEKNPPPRFLSKSGPRFKSSRSPHLKSSSSHRSSDLTLQTLIGFLPGLDAFSSDPFFLFYSVLRISPSSTSRSILTRSLASAVDPSVGFDLFSSRELVRE